ncbi:MULTISPECIES: GNAT family N-acetyltransferase [unclassified Sinorhizobium]|uniref:GNAT family N-acetyltransferase n=1 Tax=unclassified Sinorhizobium TaxID=2613772 RepID=UPI0035235198
MVVTASEAVESVQQLAKTWRAIVDDRGSGEVCDLPGLAIRWSDTKFAFFNCITLTDIGADTRLLDERLTQAVAYMRARSGSGLIWLFEDLLDESARKALPEAAKRAGLSLALTGYGMAGDFLPIAEPSHPDLRFVRVTTEEELTAYADLNSRAYGIPLEAGRDGLCGSALWKSGMYTYLGLENGIPVSAAATVETDGCLFLALVATAPEAQRKGYGGATVRKALYEGAKATGLTRTVLHATEAGFPVYKRIGYESVATIRFYGLSET